MHKGLLKFKNICEQHHAEFRKVKILQYLFLSSQNENMYQH